MARTSSAAVKIRGMEQLRVGVQRTSIP